MKRIFISLLLSTAFVAPAPALHDRLDPAFAKIPFDQWLQEDQDQLHFHWTVKVQRAELSFHQRLMSSIQIRLDGQDLDGRRRDGKLMLFIQIKDAEGARYQEHGSIELDKLDPNVKDANLDYSQRAFLVPGDYQIAVAILDTATGEHSTNGLTFHLPEPSHEWLSEAWRSLPAVEFIGDDVSPESWYLPYIRGRLPWAAGVHTAAQLNIILNVTPSGPAAGAMLAALLPSLKVIASPGSASLSERVTLLDLSRHKTVFEQSGERDLDWPRLKSSLGEASTASIDLHSLADSQENAQFFVSEVRRVLRETVDKPCVLVVLTKPVSFVAHEDLEPVSLEALPPCRVVYLRYYAAQAVRPVGPPMGGMGHRSRMGGGGPWMGSQNTHDTFDQLAATLKPLNPKIIDVESPGQVTKALSEIEKAISKSDESSR